MYAFIVSVTGSSIRTYLLEIDDIEEEHDDEITTQQSKILDDILSFLKQCEKYDRK